MTLYDLGIEIQSIRDLADSIEIKGVKNASAVMSIYEKCDRLIGILNMIAEDNTRQSVPDRVEEGDTCGQDNINNT